MSEVEITYNGGPAFPSDERIYGSDGTVIQKIEHRGMSLRQWYAGQALMGLLANSLRNVDQSFRRITAPEYAENAFAIADAMIKEGER